MFLWGLTFLKSQQEPRLLASYSRDDVMLNAYRNGRDLYATIASQIYHNNYEDNLEHYPNGTLNVEGKKRRSNCKAILLGLLYGKGVKALSEDIHSSLEEAQKIMDTFFQEFKLAHKWMEKTEADAKKNGYVEDMWGRKRRLPDIQLPTYQLSSKQKDTTNPLLGCLGLCTTQNSQKIKYYEDLLKKCKNRKEIENIKKLAQNDQISIKDNGAFIAQAERQCVNSRIQGGAASMTKIAMIKAFNDPVLNELGFKLQIPIHDEVIGECRKDVADQVSKRLVEIMVNCVSDVVICPMKCDPEISSYWYQDDYSSDIQEEFLLKKEKYQGSIEDLFQEIVQLHEESTEEQLRDILKEYMK